MKVIEASSPVHVRLWNDRYSESYLHEFPELPELEEAPFGGMICCIQPGAVTDPDFHDQSELFVVVTGSGSVIAGNEVSDIHAGQIFALPRKVEHVIKNTGDTVLTFVSVWWPRTEQE
jgi:mannose-6-phosphate isomerase-like protein (cupin superfamily)